MVTTLPDWVTAAPAPLHDRERLKACSERLRRLCEDPTEGGESWSMLCRFELSEFADALSAHLEAEEQGGYLFDLVVKRPHLRARVEELLSQHRSLLDALDATRAVLRTNIETTEAARRIRALLDAVDQHEHAETEVVQTAVNTDIGGG